MTALKNSIESIKGTWRNREKTHDIEDRLFEIIQLEKQKNK